jgi:hypothetical protein
MKSGNHARHHEQQKAVQNENEQAQRQENHWRAKDQEEWANKRIENAEQKRRSDQCSDSVISDAAEYRRSYHYSDRRSSPAEHELSGPSHLSLNLTDPVNKCEKALANEPMNDKRIITI